MINLFVVLKLKIESDAGIFCGNFQETYRYYCLARVQQPPRFWHVVRSPWYPNSPIRTRPSRESFPTLRIRWARRPKDVPKMHKKIIVFDVLFLARKFKFKYLLPNRSVWAILQQSLEAPSLYSWALFLMLIFAVVVVYFDRVAVRHWWIWSGQSGLGIYLAITH